MIPAGGENRRGDLPITRARILPSRPSSSICYFVVGAKDLRWGSSSWNPRRKSTWTIRRATSRVAYRRNRDFPGENRADGGDSTRRGLTDDLGTFPRSVMFFVAFSFAMRIRCFGAILLVRPITSARVAAAKMWDETWMPFLATCVRRPRDVWRARYYVPRDVRRRVRRVTREVARQPAPSCHTVTTVVDRADPRRLIFSL